MRYMERDRKRKGKGGNDGITFSFQKIKIIKKGKTLPTFFAVYAL